MNLEITTAWGGAGFAFATYFLALIISLLVAGMVQLVFRLIRGKTKELKPVEEKK